MNAESITKLELNKILSACSEYAVLQSSRRALCALTPVGELETVRERLNFTAECDRLLYRFGVGKVEYFSDVLPLVARAQKGSALSCAELLEVNALLRSARIAYNSVKGAEGEELPLTRRLADNIYFDTRLEEDITEKIISSEAVSDYASDALFSIRSKIKQLNERIRATLSEYVSGRDAEYLQDSIVTVRGDRFVIPVKAEHKSKIKGFVHDRSSSGATFFIEPEYVLNLNNELVALSIDEREEVERILKALSARVGAHYERLQSTLDALTRLDMGYAMAEYAYTLRAVCPKVNRRGYINIIKGRHPLIDKNAVVPVSVELGKDYTFLLLSGANTGGKTVTLKMVGLFCLMAECGLFVPAAAGSEVCAFKDVFCDVGDAQSIEESLSTFSSHINSVIRICKGADADSLVLIDELGGGTNPDEGQAIARAVVEHLINAGSRGIVTTHFTSLKEFACAKSGIENASMQFDSATLRPLYTIKIGLPGASNALAIARRLGMDESVLSAAESYLSDSARNYENILAGAEEERVRAQSALQSAQALEEEWRQKTESAKKVLESLEKDKARLGANARAESRRIINERTARAEQLLGELEEIFSKEEISQTDLIRARTLKNKIKDEGYDDEESYSLENYAEATPDKISVGAEVYVESLQSRGTILSYNANKKEAEVACGSLKMHIGLSGLKLLPKPRSAKKPEKKNERVKVVRKFNPSQPLFEINVIGMNTEEALYEVENFLDKAITDNLEQVKIIHGVGTGKLRAAIAQRLKRHRGVKEFRSGSYGEGEIGVTIVTLK